MCPVVSDQIMTHTKQTTRHRFPCPNPFIHPTMSEQQAHETFSETPASPDEPQPTLPPVPDVTPAAEMVNVATPLVIQPIGSSQEEAELEVIGTVAGDEGDVSEMTGEEIAKRKTKHRKKKPKKKKATMEGAPTTSQIL